MSVWLCIIQYALLTVGVKSPQDEKQTAYKYTEHLRENSSAQS